MESNQRRKVTRFLCNEDRKNRILKYINSLEFSLNEIKKKYVLELSQYQMILNDFESKQVNEEYLISEYTGKYERTSNITDIEKARDRLKTYDKIIHSQQEKIKVFKKDNNMLKAEKIKYLNIKNDQEKTIEKNLKLISYLGSILETIFEKTKLYQSEEMQKKGLDLIINKKFNEFTDLFVNLKVKNFVS